MEDLDILGGRLSHAYEENEDIVITLSPFDEFDVLAEVEVPVRVKFSNFVVDESTQTVEFTLKVSITSSACSKGTFATGLTPGILQGQTIYYQASQGTVNFYLGA